MKRTAFAFYLILLGLVLGSLAGCSTGSGEKKDSGSGMNFEEGIPDGLLSPDLKDLPGLEGGQPEMVPHDADVGWDSPGPELDLESQELGEPLDGTDEPEFRKLDVEKDTEPPFTYPVASFGPMTLSAKGIMIDGKFVQMRMAEVSYWKHRKEEWEALLDSVKEAGFNGIATSACWKLHERKDGKRDFQGENLALDEFLSLAEMKGLYVYFLAGPWIDGEAGGCLPGWMLSSPGTNPSAIPDGKYSIRTMDADFMNAVTAYFDELNAIVAKHQITFAPTGKVVFYQIESNYDVFFMLRDAAGRILQEMAGVTLVPLNPGAYISWLRDTVQADSISVPIVTALSGNFENGGRRLLGTGDTPGVLPAVDMYTGTEYEPMEEKLWALRKEMRNPTLHGQVYAVTPGIAVGVIPSATHMARLLLAGADVVVVRDFAAALSPSFASVGMDARGVEVFSSLHDARVSFGSSVKDFASPLSLAGVPRKTFFAFRRLNKLMERLGSVTGFAAKDMPNRSGPNAWSGSSLKISTTNPAVGAIEDEYVPPPPGPPGGILEVMGDNFTQWYLQPVEPQGRAIYYFDSADGTLVVHFVNLDDLKDGKNMHARQGQITKLLVNGITIPRHSNIIVPASDDEATGDTFLGWGSKLMLLNHPLGAGYPWIEYCSTNLFTAQEFSGTMLIVVYGKPEVKVGGLCFTEPGEISFQNIGGVPDIMHNSLPGGGIHTDPGGKLAVTFQHESTGFLKLGLPSGKQMLLMVTTTAMAERAFFGKAADGSDLAVFGMDRVDWAAGLPETLTIQGKVSNRIDSVVILVSKKPYKVEMNGEEVACDWNIYARALTCPLSLPPVLSKVVPHTEIYARTETYSGAVDDIGVSEYPEKFTVADGAPISLESPEVGVDFGVAWYTALIDMPTEPAGQDSFFSVGGAADIVSFFVNGIYLGSSSAIGNPPIAPYDAASGLPSIGFRIPPGVLVQGTNNLAIRVVALGHSPESIPLFYSAAPILPPEWDSFTSLLPHFSVDGLKPDSPKGVWGSAKLTNGALTVQVPGPWTISKGDAAGMAYNMGTIKQWHDIPPNPKAALQYGFSPIGDFSKESPFIATDGQVEWLTTTFSSNDLGHYGSLALELEGRSLVGFVFLNGKPVGVWFSDNESLSQGLHSRLLQGAGSRQLLADRGYAVHSPGTPDSVTLPAQFINTSGGQDNRVTVALIDISPPTGADLTLPNVGKVSGQGQLTRFVLKWAADEAAGTDRELWWDDLTVQFIPQPE